MATKAKEHKQDEDCAGHIGDDGCCDVCGVGHLGYCDRCGGQGYHKLGCLPVDADDVGRADR